MKQVVFFIFLSCACKLQAQDSTCNRLYDFKYRYDGVFDIIPTLDHNLIILGETDDIVTGVDSFLLLKVNYRGDTLWQKTNIIAGSLSSGYTSGVELGDSAIYALGNYFDTILNDYSISLTKYNNTGDTIWNKKYFDSLRTIGEKLIATDDSGYLIVGYSGDSINDDGYIKKIDSMGTVQWKKYFGTYHYGDYFESACKINDGYIIAGRTYSYGNNCQGWLLKTDLNGDSIWQRTYGSSNFDEFFDLIATPDGGCIVCGVSEDPLTCNALIMKVSGSGQTEWSHNYGYLDYDCQTFTKIVSVPSGGYLATGSYKIYNDDQIYGLLWRLAENGDTLWTRKYSHYGLPNEQDYFWGLAVPEPNVYAMCGYIIYNPYPTKNDAWLVVTDSCGNDTSGMPCPFDNGVFQLSERGFQIAFSPNPANDALNIEFAQNQFPGLLTIRLFDLFGQLLIEKTETNSVRSALSTTNIQPGLYFIEIDNSGKPIVKQKVVILH